MCRNSVGVVFAWMLLVSAPAWGQITVTERIAEADTANNEAFTSTTTWSVPSGTVGVCYIGNTDGDGTVETPVVTQTGQTWALVDAGSTQVDVAGTDRIGIYSTIGAGASAAAVTATVSGDTQTGFSINCFELGGDVDTSTPVVQFKMGAVDNNLSPTVTFDSARTTSSAVLFSVSADGSCDWAAESGYTLGTELTLSAPTREHRTEYVVGGTDTTPSMTLSTCGAGTDWTAGAVEINPDAAAPAHSPARIMPFLGRG